MEKQHRKPSRIVGYDYSQPGSYFITICTQDRRKILSKVTVGTGVPDCPPVELSPYGEIADRYIRQMDAFYDHLSVDQYVIMPDHIHILITIHQDRPKGQSRTPYGQSRRPVPTATAKNSEIAKFVSTFKRFCNREYGENIWQGRYYDHVIRNQEDYNEVRAYIENNPRKWAIATQS